MAVNLIKIQNIAVLCFRRRLELITSLQICYLGWIFYSPPFGGEKAIAFDRHRQLRSKHSAIALGQKREDSFSRY
jgi:hypothetical protein